MCREMLFDSGCFLHTRLASILTKRFLEIFFSVVSFQTVYGSNLIVGFESPSVVVLLLPTFLISHFLMIPMILSRRHSASWSFEERADRIRNIGRSLGFHGPNITPGPGEVLHSPLDVKPVLCYYSLLRSVRIDNVKRNI